MSLRGDYESFDTISLKLLLSRAQTERHRKLITELLLARDEHPVVWTTKRQGWVWTTPGWTITRLRRPNPRTLAEETIYQVWQDTKIYHETPDLGRAKQVVQEAEDIARYPRTED